MNVPIPDGIMRFDNFSLHRGHVFFVDPCDPARVPICKIVERPK